jgi:hypothetical protein
MFYLAPETFRLHSNNFKMDEIIMYFCAYLMYFLILSLFVQI